LRTTRHPHTPPLPYTTLFRSPSVAAAMMIGSVHLSLADVYYPAMLAGRGGTVGLAAAGALFTLGRWSHGKLREWATLHTGGGGGDRKSTRLNSSHVSTSSAVF